MNSIFSINWHKKNPPFSPYSRLDTLKNLLTVCFCVLFWTLSVLEAQVSGTVFRDFNANGAFDSTASFKEIGLSSITVTAYNASGIPVGTTTTNNTGNYTIPSVSGAVRIEFTGLGTGDYSAPHGMNNNTSIQFVTAPTTSTNFGINYPADYCQSSPELVTSCYDGGTLTGLAATNPSIIHFGYYGNDKYIGQAGYTMPSKITDLQHVGAVYGMAYSRNSKKVYTGAVLRRHAVFGPLGIGGLYEIDPLTNNVNNWLNIETLSGIDAGTDTRNQSDPANSIPNDPSKHSYDYLAFALIGKQSLGDIEISEDGKTLYVVNLFQQSIVAIDVATKTLVGSYSITASALGLTCPQSDFRPWGLKYYKGKLYVGVVCTAQTSQTATDLKAYVLQFDPTNAGSGFSIYYSLPLNYVRESNPGPWRPWNETSFDPGSSASDDSYNPQPMLSNIEFDVDGFMILGFLDRHMMMFSSANGAPDPTATSTASTSAYPGGDILRICKTSTGLILEGGTGCANNFPYSGGGEYYDDKRQGGAAPSSFKEVGGGALALLPGANEIVSTSINEYDVFENGICWWNNLNGVRNRAYMIFDKNVVGNQGKTSGLGDIELMCDAAPLEIGNRVWMDTNKNGIQDANESGIDGITILLFEGSTQVGTTTTANGGQYYFTNSNVTGGVKINTNYEIRIASAQTPLSTLTLTTTDIGSNGSDLIDSDGSISGANAVKSFTTGSAGQNNHSYDFGFQNATCLGPVSAEVSITVVPPPTVAISIPPAAVCVGANVTLTAITIIGIGTCNIQWQTSPNGTTWTDISGATGTTYNATNMSASTKYRAKLVSCTGTGCCN